MEYEIKFKTGIYNESVVKLQMETFSPVTLWSSCAPMKRSHIDPLNMELILTLKETI